MTNVKKFITPIRSFTLNDLIADPPYKLQVNGIDKGITDIFTDLAQEINSQLEEYAKQARSNIADELNNLVLETYKQLKNYRNQISANIAAHLLTTTGEIENILYDNSDDVSSEIINNIIEKLMDSLAYINAELEGNINTIDSITYDNLTAIAKEFEQELNKHREKEKLATSHAPCFIKNRSNIKLLRNNLVFSIKKNLDSREAPLNLYLDASSYDKESNSFTLYVKTKTITISEEIHYLQAAEKIVINLQDKTVTKFSLAPEEQIFIKAYRLPNTEPLATSNDSNKKGKQEEKDKEAEEMACELSKSWTEGFRADVLASPIPDDESLKGHPSHFATFISHISRSTPRSLASSAPINVLFSTSRPLNLATDGSPATSSEEESFDYESEHDMPFNDALDRQDQFENAISSDDESDGHDEPESADDELDILGEFEEDSGEETSSEEEAAENFQIEEIVREVQCLQHFHNKSKLDTQQTPPAMLGQCIAFSMQQFIIGKNLADIVKELADDPNKYSEEEIVEYIVATAVAVFDLHKKKIMHGDLKKDAVFITKDDKPKQARITDLASAIIEVHKEFITFTEIYCPPEVYAELDNKPQDDYSQTRVTASVKHDVYTLGVLILELLGYDVKEAAREDQHAKKQAGIKVESKSLNRKIYSAEDFIKIRSLFSKLPTTGGHLHKLVTQMLSSDPAIRPDMINIVSSLNTLKGLLNPEASASNNRNSLYSSSEPSMVGHPSSVPSSPLRP